MKWGIANVKAKVGGSGGAELNLAYGLTPPNDTSKIWVRTSVTPESVEITDNPTWSDTITATTIKSDLENITNSFMCRAGEYVYIFGGLKDGASINKIRRYNTITGDFETLDIELPYGAIYCEACSKGDYIYIAYAVTYDGSNYYSQPRILKFNWKTNRIVATNQYESANYRPSHRISTHSAIIGDKLFVMNGKAFSSPSYLGAGSTNYVYVYSASSGGNFQDNVWNFDLSTLTYNWYSTTNGFNNQNNNIAQKINKAVFVGGGNLSSGYSMAKFLSWDTIHSGIKDDVSANGMYIQNSFSLYGKKNIFLVTNSKLYVAGGYYGTASNNVAITNGIYVMDYSTQSSSSTGITLDYSIEWSACQFDCQTSYGVGETYLVKLENKLSLEENKLLIIPDIENDEEYILSTIEGINLKTSIQNVYIGNSSNKADMVRCYQYDGTKWVGINCDDYIPQEKENISYTKTYYEVSSAVSLSSYIVCNIGDLIIASVIARDSGNEYVNPIYDWELIGRSQVGASNQTLAFYKKIATSEVEIFGVSQTSQARIYVSLVSFNGKDVATLGEIKTANNTSDIGLTLPTNKICVVSSASVSMGTNTPSWTYKDINNLDFNDFDAFFEGTGRLLTIIEYGTGGTRTAISNGSTSGNTMFIGYVEIGSIDIVE